MAKTEYMSIEKQEELVRSFIKTYSRYLDRSELKKNYSSLKGRKYLEDGIAMMLDKDGFYLFSSEEDDRKHFRIALWLETNSDDSNFYPITELRWKRFVEQFEKRNINKSR